MQYRDSPDGLLQLALTTASKKSVEINEIRVEYASPLQLFNPGDLDFFKSEISNDLNLPFRLVWRGSMELKRNLLQLIAVQVKFPDTVQARAIRLSVQAKVVDSSTGGFRGHGRNHLTVFRYRIRLVSQVVRGIRLPPGASLSTQQPFLIKRQLGVTANCGAPVQALVHELLEDGSSTTKEYR